MATEMDKAEATRLSSVLAGALLAAAREEQTARGEFRRIAFRNTRYLIFGAVSTGAFFADIAQLLNTAIPTIRNRTGGDGLIATTDFALLAGVSTKTITQWRARGKISASATTEDGRPGHLASELVKMIQG